MTLQDILQYSVGNLSWNGTLGYQEDWSPYSKRGLSILRPLDLNRTCEQAGIPEDYCACRIEESIDVEQPIVKAAAVAALQHLNKLLKPVVELCAVLKLNETKSAEKVLNSNWKPEMVTGETSIRVTIQTEPGGGLFEVNLKIPKRNGPFVAIGDVDRINRYNDDSICIIDEPILKKICF